VEIADTGLQQGHGMHDNFSRADTMNFMAALGPSFKSGFVDEAPTSNADVGRTMAYLLGLKIEHKGRLVGRVLEEALPNGQMPEVSAHVVRSEPNEKGLSTVVKIQRAGSTNIST